MTQEQKQLLLQDLCMRLPYGVKVEVRIKDKNIKSVDCVKYDTVGTYIRLLDDEKFSIKPYLRPMSSMTEEEKEEFKELSSGVVWRKDVLRDIVLDIWYETDSIDWLNAHHFDYRGLIPMELAIKALEGMYNTKTE